MKLWDRIKRGMDAGFDAAVTAVYNITEKAGESIELTRLRREKVRLETELTKHLAELGNVVYEKISESRLDEVTEQLQIQEKMLEIAREEAQMVDIDRRLDKEVYKKDSQIEKSNQDQIELSTRENETKNLITRYNAWSSKFNLFNPFRSKLVLAILLTAIIEMIIVLILVFRNELPFL